MSASGKPQAESGGAQAAAGAGAGPDARELVHELAPYRRPSRLRSLFELMVTAGAFILLWWLMWLVLDHGYWLSLLLAVPTAAFLVRLFMIQHDCGHGAFFRRRMTNDWVGRAVGILTLTPYDYWRRTHAIHHATSGNLDQRGIGDVGTLTVSEYLALPWWRRLAYRAYRNPVVLFGLGPAYLFALQYRLPFGLMRGGWRPWISTAATNAGIALVVAVMMWLLGVGDFLAVHIPVLVLASSAGVWLFFVQHQFKDTTWRSQSDWNVHEAALHGSSYYDLPVILRWLTANIGIHHVHHLSSKIPFYRLPQVLRDHPELARIGRLTLADSLKCVKLVLWDEARHDLISFADLKAQARA